MLFVMKHFVHSVCASVSSGREKFSLEWVLLKPPYKYVLLGFVNLYQLFLDIVLLSPSLLECLSADKVPENPESDTSLTPTYFIALAITTFHRRWISGNEVLAIGASLS